MGVLSNSQSSKCYCRIAILILVGLAIVLVGVFVSQDNERPKDEWVECEIRTILVDDEINGDSVAHECIITSTGEMVYNLPSWFIDEHIDELESRPTSYLNISKGHIALSQASRFGLRSFGRHAGDNIVIAKDSEVLLSDTPFSEQGHRNLAKPTTSGVNSILIVRISALDSTPNLSAETLADRFFGPEDHTVATAFSSCSFGGVQVEPATGDLITNGVVEVALDINVRGEPVTSIENTVTTALADLIGSVDDCQHVVYCMPPGTQSRHGDAYWSGGYSHVAAARSVHSDVACGYLDHMVHELSHNFGLGHAREGTDVYGDRSGRMGRSYKRVGFPIKCFNGAMTAQLGWYDDKQVTVDLSNEPWSGRLYGFTDYDLDSAPVVRIRAGDLFIQYNKAVGINQGTTERKNMVTVTHSTLAPASESTALGGISLVGLDLTVPNFNGSDQDFILEVCGSSDSSTETPDYFDISIRLSSQDSLCAESENAAPAASIAPTYATNLVASIVNQITMVPSTAPSSTPSALPSSTPSALPSLIPSTLPTATTASPSSSDMPSPSIIAIIEPPELACKDNDEGGMFFSSGLCTMLNENPERIPHLCQFGYPTYWLCQKTCGTCP